ncbi:MAG: GT4 family glycosyltransferase PelF [Desulfuromonadales bacterium]
MARVRFPRAAEVDIMLLLEGTFPFVSGGVSSWVNQMIRGFPQWRFGAVFLGSRREDYEDFKYELPDNLIHLEEHYLHGDKLKPVVTPCRGDAQGFEVIRELHEWFLNPQQGSLPEGMKNLAFYRDSRHGVDFFQFLHAERSWDFIAEKYRSRCTDPSFVDYFWTVRNMHMPVWQLAEIAANLIPARLYHTVSTGYAGFLGALLHHATGRKLLLSEHGIYTKERRIDILHNEWILDRRNPLQKDLTEVSYYRELWIRFFETLGRFCYDAAGTTISLFEGARQREIADGATAERTRVIPNGIELSHFSPLRRLRPMAPPPIIALLGRVVPIKDVKTFIRSLRILSARLPEVQGWIVGPTDEAPHYVEECRRLAESLAVDDRVHFKGFMDPRELFPQIGLLALTSISEGLPLVALEGYAAGIPLVATDVGSCRQLVEGLGKEDEALGQAGAVVPINNPQAVAEACLELLRDPDAWQTAQAAAVARVERFYTQERMFTEYRQLYEEGLAPWQA